MKNLLQKEFQLALHPTSILFWFLSAMLLIPSYPYYVIFFYTCLGVFFVCLTGRENHDIDYAMLLPIRKTDLVSARILTVVIIELVQFAVAVPFAILRNGMPEGNDAGMDANVAFFGLAFVMMGLFNLVFFPNYYKDPDKVGKPFLFGCIAVGVFIAAAETLAFALPFGRDVLDTKDPQFMPYKLALLAVGIAVFALLTLLAASRSRRAFERRDL